jgi:hypothetical protein
MGSDHGGAPRGWQALRALAVAARRGGIVADDSTPDTRDEFGWRPQRQGILVKHPPAPPQNGLSVPELRLFAEPPPGRAARANAILRLSDDPAHGDAQASLHLVGEVDAAAARRGAPRDLSADLQGGPRRRAGRLHPQHAREQASEPEALPLALVARRAAWASAASR